MQWNTIFFFFFWNCYLIYARSLRDKAQSISLVVCGMFQVITELLQPRNRQANSSVPVTVEQFINLSNQILRQFRKLYIKTF